MLTILFHKSKKIEKYKFRNVTMKINNKVKIKKVEI